MREDLRFEHGTVEPTAHAWSDGGEGYDAWGGVAAADFDGDGRPDVVGRVRRANDPNGADGKNQIDCLRNATG